MGGEGATTPTPGLDPVCAFHGLRAAEHKYGRCLYCCLCFVTLTPDECHEDEHGIKWDVCKPCAAMEALVAGGSVGAPEDQEPK